MNGKLAKSIRRFYNEQETQKDKVSLKMWKRYFKAVSQELKARLRREFPNPKSPTAWK